MGGIGIAPGSVEDKTNGGAAELTMIIGGVQYDVAWNTIERRCECSGEKTIYTSGWEGH